MSRVRKPLVGRSHGSGLPPAWVTSSPRPCGRGKEGLIELKVNGAVRQSSENGLTRGGDFIDVSVDLCAASKAQDVRMQNRRLSIPSAREGRQSAHHAVPLPEIRTKIAIIRFV
jgi:hypothetical protein